MSNNLLHIGKPYVEDRGKGIIRVCSDVLLPNGTEKKLVFEIDAKWKDYVIVERSDAFILALFNLALEKGWNISYEAPMTEELNYQLTTYGITILPKYINIYKKIALLGETISDEIESKGEAATGFSAGVDSFYSVLRHSNMKYDKKNVSYLLFARNGAVGPIYPEESGRELFDALSHRFIKYAEDLDLEYIPIWSNIPDFYENRYRVGCDIITTSSFVYLLRKLLGVYYWASAYEADVLDFHKGATDLGYIEPFSVPLVSINGLKFYHSGSELSRIQKVEYIADNKIVQKGITPCGKDNGKNCGKCCKCRRTMGELYAIGMLNYYESAFPIDNYLKNYIWELAYEIAEDHPPYTTEIIQKLKENKRWNPLIIFLGIFVCKPIVFLRKYLGRNYHIRKLYYALHLDGVIGAKHDEETKKVELEKCRLKNR